MRLSRSLQADFSVCQAGRWPSFLSLSHPRYDFFGNPCKPLGACVPVDIFYERLYIRRTFYTVVYGIGVLVHIHYEDRVRERRDVKVVGVKAPVMEPAVKGAESQHYPSSRRHAACLEFIGPSSRASEIPGYKILQLFSRGCAFSAEVFKIKFMQDYPVHGKGFFGFKRP